MFSPEEYRKRIRVNGFIVVPEIIGASLETLWAHVLLVHAVKPLAMTARSVVRLCGGTLKLHPLYEKYGAAINSIRRGKLRTRSFSAGDRASVTP